VNEQGGLPFPDESSGIFSSLRRGDNDRSDNRKTDLPTMAMAGQLQLGAQLLGQGEMGRLMGQKDLGVTLGV
jgi:hypothetical protein